MDTTHTSAWQSAPWARRLRDALDAPSGWTFLDVPAGPLRKAVAGLPLGPYRDALHGVWLGHPLHPALVQVPFGCWLSAGLLDATGLHRRAASFLVAAGLATVPPAALAGWVDWAKLDPPRQRTGLVHGLANTTGVALYAASLAARLRGRRMHGRLLGFAGLAVISGGAALGGHLAYRQAAGPNRAAEVERLADPDWREIGTLDDFPDGEPVLRMAGQLPVVVVRSGPDCTVMAGRCSHLSGPLADGALVDGCLVCPWHGSEFRLTDGRVVNGPATAPQPVFETRVLAGHLEVRLPEGG
ncbi:Rieske 2Fe-2S domain-containing protein [Kitasatospora sp. NPDC054939]